MNKRHALVLFGLSVLLVLAGCGDDTGDTNGSSNTTGGAAAGGSAMGGSATGGAATGGTTTGGATTGGMTGTGGMTPVEVDLRIPGLDGEVNAAYDANGVLHLSCQSDNDCVAALGYFHASERMILMDFLRRSTLGSLTAFVAGFSEVTLPIDYSARHFMTTRNGEPLEQAIFDNLNDETKAVLERYSAGVNAWIQDWRDDRNNATVTPEYTFLFITREAALDDWKPTDTIAVLLYGGNLLANSSESEIFYGQSLAALQAPLAQDLYTLRPVYEVDTTTSAGETFRDGSNSGIQPLSVGALQRRLASHRGALQNAGQTMRHMMQIHGPIDHSRGSNNWVVAGSQTSSGRSLLANDPHLSISNPSIWFPAVLDSKTNGTGTFRVAGAGFVGAPGILSGHNDDIAWGVTTTFWDMTDVYQETLNEAGTAVIFNGNEVPIVTRDYSFLDASTGEMVTQTFEWVPHHGPLISKDTANRTGISVRWVGHDGDATDITGFLELNRASTIEEARTALNNITLVAQSFVVADADNIGWFPFANIPQRPWDRSVSPAWLPLPGDGTAEWGPYFAKSDLPQLFNPTNGFAATANQDLMGSLNDGNPDEAHGVLQQAGRAPGVRMQRIVDRINERSDHDVASMLDIQADTYSLYGEIFTPVLIAAADGGTLNASGQRVADALRNWTFTCPTGLDGSDPEMAAKSTDMVTAREAIGCAAFHVALFEMRTAVFGDELNAMNASAPSTFQLVTLSLMVRNPSLLTAPDTYWDDVSTTDTMEDQGTTLRKALESAGARLDERFPSMDSDDWRWGRIHTVAARSPFDSFGTEAYNTPSYANDGGLSTVDVANPGNRANLDFYHTSGPSIRTVIDFSSGSPELHFQMPGGALYQSNDPLRLNLFDEWLTNTPIRYGFGGPENPDREWVIRAPE